MRFSMWSAPVLGDEQLRYALCDAYASAVIGQHLISSEDFNKIPSHPALVPGTTLRLYNSGGQRVAGVGRVATGHAVCTMVNGNVLTQDNVVVIIDAITIPATRLMDGPGTLSQKGVGSSVVWKRSRVRLLPADWCRDESIIGRTWTDPSDTVPIGLELILIYVQVSY